MRPLLSAGLFAAFLAVFLCLRSHDYTAVDGALRALSLYDMSSFPFHGNNHLLYPFWIWTWNQLANHIGIRASNAFEFIRISQAMNAFFGAGALVIFYSILRLFVESETALAYTLGFGFSTAFLLHATNSAEPMPGLFFCLAGMRVMMSGLRHNSRLILAVSGMLLAVALASYQSMGTVAGVGIFACLWWAWARQKDHCVVRGMVSLLWAGLGAFLAVCGIYGTVYAKQGIQIARMPHQFLLLAGGKVYSGFSVSRVVNTPIGLLRNLFSDMPPAYSGMRALLHDPQRSLWIPLMAAGLAVCSLIAWRAGKALRSATRGWPGWLVLTAWGATALLFFPLLYWDPENDKLWLLPLGTIAAVLAFSSHGKPPSVFDRKILTALLVLVLATEGVVNFPLIVRDHTRATPYLSEATDLRSAIAPNDWVVLDFDDISALWLGFWGRHANSLMLPASNAEAASQWLAQAKRAAQQSAAKIVFVGVLDQDPQTWNLFLGNRVGIPYTLLDEYRGRATVLRAYGYANGRLTVRSFR